MSNLYKQAQLTVIKCIGCDKSCIYEEKYSNNYCMNCINRLNYNKYKREAFKRMLEGVKRNVIKTQIKYDYYDDCDDSDDFNVFIQDSNNEDSEGLIKSSFYSLVKSIKNIFNSLTECNDKTSNE